jgi:tRNA threonylcarbamoyladenosine biosynthesis protein TsaB
MNLLAFDTSTEYLSLAVKCGGEMLSYDVLAGQSHSQMILPQIQALLDKASLQLKDVHGLAFGAGPGSFTGVRIAAGVAQGLGFGANLPVAPIGTLLALAEAAHEKTGNKKVIACLDARMGEVYHAAYVKTGEDWQTIMAPGLYKPQEVPGLASYGKADLNSGTQDWIGAGSGWKTYPEALGYVYAEQLNADHAIHAELLPTATAILKLAEPLFLRGKAGTAAQALPIYIRNRVALKTAEREQGLRL